MAEPYNSRPVGVKRWKLEAVGGTGIVKIFEYLDAVREAIRNSASFKIRDASLALQYKIIGKMALSKEGKDLRFQILLGEVRSLGNGAALPVGIYTPPDPPPTEDFNNEGVQVSPYVIQKLTSGASHE